MGWGGSQRSRDHNKIRAVSEKPGQKSKSHKGWEGSKEARTLRKQKLSQRSQDKKENHTWVGEGLREAGTTAAPPPPPPQKKNQNDVPEKLRQKSKPHDAWGGPREAGTLTE